MSPQLSRDGRFVAATETTTDNQTPAAEHRALKIWEVDSGREAFMLPIPDHNSKVTFHPSEPKIVVTLTDLGPDPKFHAKVFDLNDARELAQIPISAVESVFHRDGSLFAVIVTDRNRSDIQLQMYDANANYAHLWTVPLGTANAIRFSQDGNWIAVASGPGIRIFGARDGREGAAMLGHSAIIRSLGFCERTGNLLSIDASGIVKRWQVDSNLGRNIVQYLPGSPPKAISFDGSRFATVKIEPTNSVTVLDQSGKVLWESPRIEGKIQSLSCGTDGRRVAALATSDHKDAQSTTTIYVWDADSRRELLRRQFAGKQDPMVKPMVSIDPTGDLIAVSHAFVDSHPQVIEISSGQPIQSLEVEKEDAIMWSPCGRWLVSTGLNIFEKSSVAPVAVRIWDAKSGLLKWDSKAKCNTIDFSADGNWACAVQGDGASHFINVVSLETGKETQRLHIPERIQGVQDRFAIAMSNNGQSIAIAKVGSSSASRIQVWNRLQPDRPKWSIQIPNSVGNERIMLDFNSDGSRLAAALDDSRTGNIRLWSTESGDELLRLPVAATWLAFNQDGTALSLRRDLGGTELGATSQTFELNAAPIPAEVEGRTFVQNLFATSDEELQLPSEIMANIESSSLSVEARHAAREELRQLDQTDQFVEGAWSIVSQPGHTVARYERALQLLAEPLASMGRSGTSTTAPIVHGCGRSKGSATR